jgi:hypothetical protein
MFCGSGTGVLAGEYTDFLLFDKGRALRRSSQAGSCDRLDR